LAPKPLTGNIAELGRVDKLLWFDKYCINKRMTEDEQRDLFIMTLLDAAADWVTGFLRRTDGRIFGLLRQSKRMALEGRKCLVARNARSVRTRRGLRYANAHTRA
jgi:hypothetical protein